MGVVEIVLIILGIIAFIGILICLFIYIWRSKFRDKEKDDGKLSKSMQEINTSQVVLAEDPDEFEEGKREAESEGEDTVTVTLGRENEERVAMVKTVHVDREEEGDVQDARIFNY